VDFERFFNGGLQIPPIDLRERVARMLRRLRDRPGQSHAESFRLLQLEARFNSYNELQNRRLREREEGQAAVVPVAPAQPRFDPREGIVLSERLIPEAVEALYVGLCSAGQGARLDLETFRGYLGRQMTEIRGKTGCQEVKFRVVDEGGQLKLKARPIKAEAASV
jgi:hypothetical protein